ncbi:hypothetical protein An11g05540 [Aspergillus niger]|uniref:Uncharacterized protein n=2 Tax=Aspergillus niger TaxID=5061 RepID=A2QWK7_ASPNC|nr:hypothetical protein An11g05540 [Aspergillus niger]CAK40711.1 hypothetical protein An11g05540 [Aspergillus niger]
MISVKAMSSGGSMVIYRRIMRGGDDEALAVFRAEEGEFGCGIAVVVAKGEEKGYGERVFRKRILGNWEGKERGTVIPIKQGKKRSMFQCRPTQLFGNDTARSCCGRRHALEPITAKTNPIISQRFGIQEKYSVGVMAGSTTKALFGWKTGLDAGQGKIIEQDKEQLGTELDLAVVDDGAGVLLQGLGEEGYAGRAIVDVVAQHRQVAGGPEDAGAGGRGAAVTRVGKRARPGTAETGTGSNVAATAARNGVGGAAIRPVRMLGHRGRLVHAQSRLASASASAARDGVVASNLGFAAWLAGAGHPVGTQ